MDLNRALVMAFTLCILACIVFLTCAVLMPQPGKAFTEFYILGPDGKAGNYPDWLHLGDNVSVIAGIVNHEHRDMAYDLVVQLNDTANVTRLYEEKVTVAAGDKWEKAITLTPDRIGTGMKIELLLFANGNYAVPYRDLRLIVDITKKLY